MTSGADKQLVSTVRRAYEDDAKAGKLELKNSFCLKRGNYLLASVLDENAVSDKPLVLKGLFIDLFTNTLPVVTKKIVLPGEQAFLYDLSRIKDKNRPQVIAAASRQYDEHITANSYSFVSKSPKNTTNVMRILLPKTPVNVRIDALKASYKWDKRSNTLLVGFENSPDGVAVRINWK